MNITSNLHDALLHFRARSRNHSIWIDSICTNQDNVSERNSQISIMGRIFAFAKLVVIRLGKSPKSIGRTIEHMAALLALPDTTSDVVKRHPRPRSSANSKVGTESNKHDLHSRKII